MSKPFTITDARGRKVQMWGGDTAWDALKALAPAERKKVKDLVRPVRLRWNQKITRSLALYLLVFVSFEVILMVVITMFFKSAPSWLGVVIVGWPAGMLAGFWMNAHLRKSTDSRKYTSLVLGFGRCPTCFYRLEGLVSEPDGCIICPECGGAWRIDDDTTRADAIP